MRQEAGFTLIELLAAMVAGSMLLVSLGWTVASLGRELAQSKADAGVARFETAARTLRSLIEQASPPAPNGSGFIGSADRLQAIVPPPMAAGAAGPLRLTLRIATSDAGQDMLARFEPVEPSSPFPAALRAERPLLTGYRSMRFDYEAVAGGQEPALPRLITFTAVEADGTVRRISAAPRIDNDGRCRFDPVSMTCRY
jgi:prepilin-type N-terminal cleavage/methylation domain-containing protein